MSGKHKPPNFPVSSYLTVRDGQTLSKSDGWWRAVVVYEESNSSKLKLAKYLWKQRDDGGWRQIQKWTVQGTNEWNEEKRVAEKYLSQVG